MNLPNRLTLTRCVLAAIFVVLMSFPSTPTYIVAYIVFTAAAITDHFDGRIARKYNLITNFGKLMDPVADKVLMLAAFVMLMQVEELWIPGWAVVTILAREFLITGARTLAAAEGLTLPANSYGKAKTVLQMVYVFTFFALVIGWRLLTHAGMGAAYGDAVRTTFHRASMIGIVLVAIYTAVSGVQFALANWKALNLHQVS